MEYSFTNVLGQFIIDGNFKIIKKGQSENPEVPKKDIPKILAQLKDKKYHQEFYIKNLELTKASIKQSVSEDSLIVQTIANINELDRTANTLIKRLREWYALYFPEFEHKFTHQEKFVSLILEKNREELMKAMNITKTMGANLEEVHVEEMKLLAKRIQSLQLLRKEHEEYLEKVMRKYCPNLLELAGVTIGAKLLELGKSLKRLALLPASTVQLLGAEKALFRHIKTGARSPKYGVIFQHQIIQNAKRQQRGKAARILADKLSLCCRLDYFKGELKAPEYRAEIERKLQ
jgi:nucleolar protein 56